MEDARSIVLRIRQAAFALAERMDWSAIGMRAIAAQAGIGLPEFMRHAPSKSSILQAFGRDIDEAMLLVFERYPAEGEPHDRIFDVMLKRLEILGPYRAVIASVLRSRKADPGEALGMLQSVTESIGCMVVAARVEEEAPWRSLGRLGLMRAYLRALSVWAKSDDPGMTRTMAALDRALRDSERFSERASTVVNIASGMAKAAGSLIREFFEGRKKT
jgi:AcrR family transcriptional regulator